MESPYTMVTWEAVTAISTAITTIVLILTVLLGRRQLELLRRSTQLDGLIKVLSEIDAPPNAASYRFVMHELAERMRDPAYRSRIARGETDDSIDLYLPTLRLFERIGAYVRYGLLDADTVYCQAGNRAVRAWLRLKDVVDLARARGGPGVWDSYEALVAGTIRYFRTANPYYPEPYRDPGAGRSAAAPAAGPESQAARSAN